jgi:hypothetical protein
VRIDRAARTGRHRYNCKFTWSYTEVDGMASKDKNAKKNMAKKPAQKTLKEKRQAKKAKQ